MVEADQSQEGKVKQNFEVTLSVGIMTREITLPINARNQRRTRLKYKKCDDDESANVATDEFDDALIYSLDSLVDSWVMDSGVSFLCL